MYRHCSASPRCGTCLRYPAAGAARSRSPLSPRHPPSLCSVGSRSRVPSSFHPHALRHLTTRSARVRSRSQPLFSIVPGLSSEPSSQPLGGCRCALCRRNNCSVLLPPLGGSYPAQPAADPGLLLVGAGNNSTPRCPPQNPALCTDRRPERHARLAAGCVCLTLLQHSNILNRLLLPFFHFSPPAPCWHKMINYDLLLLGRSCADCSRADWRSACRPACRPVCCCICMQLQPVATICSQSRVKSSNRILFSLIFSALSQFFPARDARISWLFSAFCSNNVLEQ